MRPSHPDLTERIRTLCLRFPEVEERQSHGECAWFSKGKRQFACMSDHHHDDRLSVVCAAQHGVQEGLVTADAGRFYRPPYVGGRGWVGVYLDVPGVDWEELAGLLESAHRFVTQPR